jgi:hypothetical protein
MPLLMKLSWSSGPTITYTVQSGVTVVSQNSSQITISSISSADIPASTSKFLLGWNFVNPPSTRPFTLTLTSLYSTGGSAYGIDTLTNSYNCNSGSIVTYSLTALNYAINALTTYTITFSTVNTLTTGSFIAIVFPPYITLSGSCSSTNGALSCAVSNTSYANISISGPISGGTSLSIKFTSVTNPSQAFTSAPFAIYTYYDSGLDSLVDKLTSGMTFTGQANLLPLSNVFVVPSSLFTYASSNYIFSLQLTDSILAGGYIAIAFPSAITLGSVGIVTASFSTGSCSLAVSGSSVNITGCFAATYTTLAITFTLSGILNPPSLQTTASFAISTYGPLGKIDYISAGLSITMTNASTSTSFTLTPQALTVHSYAVYSLAVAFLIPHSAGDYLLLVLPASMAISASPACTATSGIAVITCSVFNASTLKMVMTSVPSSSIAFTISSIRNYDISSTSVPLQCSVYSSSDYLMEATPVSSASYTVAAISSFAVSCDNQIVLNSASNLTITLSAPFAIDSSFTPALTSLILTIPA